VVYFSHYLEWADVGVVEYWRAAGLFADTSIAGGAVEFHVVRAEVDYRAPMLLDEEIDICVATTAIGNSSMGMAVELHGAAATGDDLRARIALVQVHVAEARGAPTRIPDWMVERIERLEGHALRKERAET
jgi:acyl-CoA thioester hydrolase